MLDLAVDRGDHAWRQLQAQHQRVVEDEHLVERDAVVLAVFALLLGALDHALAQHRLGVRADLLLNLLTLGRIDLFGGVFGDDFARPVADFRAQHAESRSRARWSDAAAGWRRA